MSIAERECRMIWRGKQSEALLDTTRNLDIEGAFRASKTTLCLWKVLNSCLEHPGIHWLICRYGDDDTDSKLRPPFERICLDAGVGLRWDSHAKYYELGNQSRVYAFGLKAQDMTMRYAKLRGLTLAGIYNDQSEELPYDVYLELKGRMSQSGYPHQLILSPNPMEEDSWMAREFPEDNHIAGHKYLSLSIYDNEANLPPDTIPGLLESYPPGHAKHRPAVLGLRGLNVIGDPVYGVVDAREPESAAFQRSRHERPLELDPNLPLYEAIDYGKSHPCVVWAQYTPWSAVRVLGGVMGQNLFLEDFAPIVQQYRARWFPDYLELQTCCDPAGAHGPEGLRQNSIKVLEDLGFIVTYKADSNMPAVRLAMIERLAGAMRRRTPQGEAFAVDSERWIRISAKSALPHKFLADGLEAGYVWDKNVVSVANKPMRKPKKDGWYEHGQNCLEYLEHNFGGVQPTLEQSARRAMHVRAKDVKDRQRDVDPYDLVARRQGRNTFRRGGY